MDKRRSNRMKYRQTCELRFGGQRARGIVLDVSPSGLFVQTGVSPAPTGVVEVHLDQQGSAPAMLIRALVRRQQKVDARLVTVAPSGLGLEVLDAPDAYYALVGGERPRRRAAKPAPVAAAAQPGTGFRVRVAQKSGPRSRWLELVAADEEAAGELALARVGEGWKVVEIRPKSEG